MMMNKESVGPLYSDCDTNGRERAGPHMRGSTVEIQWAVCCYFSPRSPGKLFYFFFSFGFSGEVELVLGRVKQANIKSREENSDFTVEEASPAPPVTRYKMTLTGIFYICKLIY